MMLENEKVHKYIRDEEVSAEYWTNANELSLARAWATKNQGLMRSGRKYIIDESESLSTRQWFEILDVTKDFTKGSWLYVTPEEKQNISAEKFFGFRQRLEKRYAWLNAYILKKFEETTMELDAIRLEDPNEKIYHNIRPSKATAIQKAHEANYYKRKAEVEKAYELLSDKISKWNTYFGTPEERGL